MKMGKAGKHTSSLISKLSSSYRTCRRSLDTGCFSFFRNSGGSQDKVFYGERLALEHRAFHCENGCCT